MSLIRKHGAVLQAWACLDLVFKYFESIFIHLFLSHILHDLLCSWQWCSTWVWQL